MYDRVAVRIIRVTFRVDADSGLVVTVMENHRRC